MSDLLGDNLLFGSLGSFQGRRLGSILSNINASAIYLNRSRRVNWGFGAFRTKGRNFEGDQRRGVRGDRLRRARTHSLSAEPVQPDRGHLHRGALRPGGLHPAGGPASPGGMDRDPSPELRARQLALDQQRSDRRRTFQPHRRPVQRLHQQPVRQLPGERRLAALPPARPPEHLGASGVRLLQRRRPARAAPTSAAPRRSAAIPSSATSWARRPTWPTRRSAFPLLTHLTLGTPFGDVDFPEIQGALFTDVGKATFETFTDRAVLGSYGISFRMALGPLAVLRFDHRAPLQQRRFPRATASPPTSGTPAS